MEVLDTIGASFREAFFMLWETLWALVLGFGLSGVVQSFVSRGQMQRVMGGHGPAALARSSLLGSASSSCSYAASALARALFARGADFTAAMVFMVASTNLVVELGIVLWLLIGWQFTLAQFVGGALMIVLLGLALPRLIPTTLVEAARRRLDGAGEDTGVVPDGNSEKTEESQPVRARLRQPARWADAAGYTISDLSMLRREIVVGFVAAGFISVAVPTGFWNAVFLHDHGAWTVIENAALGPLVAVLSFVCSIGNIPLAAALWKDGISFGGVIAFVFADLITLPLLLIYRTLYGGRLTVRLFAIFWAVMSIAGIVVEVVFRGLGLVPTTRPTVVAPTHFGWDYTTYLNIVFLVVFAGIVWLYRSRNRLGGGVSVAVDPVCGMQVERANPGDMLHAGGTTTYFCSGHCKQRYLVGGRTRHGSGEDRHADSSTSSPGATS